MPREGPTAREHLLYAKLPSSFAKWIGRKGHQGQAGKSDLIAPEYWASQYQTQGNREVGGLRAGDLELCQVSHSGVRLCMLQSEMDNISSLRLRTVNYFRCNVGMVTRAFPDTGGSSKRGLILLDSIWHDVSNCHAV